MTQTAAAAILKMAPSTLSHCLHRVLTRVRTGHKIRGLVTLGADEIAYCKAPLINKGDNLIIKPSRSA